MFCYNLSYPKIALPRPPIITHLTFGILVDAFVPFVTVHLSLFFILPLSQVIFRLLLNNG